MDQIAKLLGKPYGTLFKRLGNNPKALTKFVYVTEVLPKITEYMVTDKADGVRAFIIVKPGSKIYITSVEQKNLTDVPNNLNGIFDCEYIEGKFYIFDVLEWNGQSVINNPFHERHQILTQIKPSSQILVKTYKPLSIDSYQMNIAAKYNEKKPYKIDGLIFTSINESYLRTVNLKWKPPHQLTIDFLYMSGVLWVGMNRRAWKKYGFPLPQNYRKMLHGLHVDNFMRGNMITAEYFPVPFETSMQVSIDLPDFTQYEGKIIELSIELDAKKNYKWVFHKTRDDKIVDLNKGYYGNDYRIAELTLQSALNPLTMKDLIASYTAITNGFYFRKQDDTYHAIRKYNNYVKQILIQRHTSSSVIDLASGKGPDMMKYINSKASALNLIEIDKNAIEELLVRKYEMFDKVFVPNMEAPINIFQEKTYGITMRIWCLDLNDNWKDNVEKLSTLSVIPRNIFCNFALHYMLWDLKHIENICAFINHYLQQGCEFIFTAFSGEKVKPFIKSPWETQKYSITASKKSGAIRVRLPCSDEPYDEPLVNLSVIDKVFKKYKILRTEHAAFSMFLSDFRQFKPQFARLLDSEDLKFIDLYSYTVYKKN